MCAWHQKINYSQADLLLQHFATLHHDTAIMSSILLTFLTSTAARLIIFHHWPIHLHNCVTAQVYIDINFYVSIYVMIEFNKNHWIGWTQLHSTIIKLSVFSKSRNWGYRKIFPIFPCMDQRQLFFIGFKKRCSRAICSKNSSPLATESIQFPALHFAVRTKHVRGRKVVILLKKRQYWLCSPEIPAQSQFLAVSERAAD